MAAAAADKHYYTVRKTANYEYELHFALKASRNGYTSAHMYVGDPKNPCLSISLNLMDSLANNRFDASEFSIAYLNKIKSMKECILSGTDSTSSFAKEIMHDAFHVLRMNYPHIHHIKLTDSSFIPCGENDTLDLLHYSVALYGKTWYELNYDAYFVPRDAFIEYKCKVYEYSKKETKPKWTEFIRLIYTSLNPFARDYFDENTITIKDMYELSTTYPEFFRKLSDSVPRPDKCTFFRGWLESFIETFVIIPRTWYIDLYNVSVKSKRKGGTRKNYRKK